MLIQASLILQKSIKNQSSLLRIIKLFLILRKRIELDMRSEAGTELELSISCFKEKKELIGEIVYILRE